MFPGGSGRVDHSNSSEAQNLHGIFFLSYMGFFFFASIPEYINICFKIKNVYHLTKSFLQENTPCLSCCLCTACSPGSGSSSVWGIARTLGWGWRYLDSPIFSHKLAVWPWENHLKLLFSIFLYINKERWVVRLDNSQSPFLLSFCNDKESGMPDPWPHRAQVVAYYRP